MTGPQDVSGDRVGFRYWLLTTRATEPLVGPYSHAEWVPGWVAAVCDVDPAHRPPVEGCGCGMAVLASLPEAAAKLAGHIAADRAFTRATTIEVHPRVDLAPVIGAVRTSGPWLPDSDHPGHVWRTRRAVIAELWLPGRLAGHADRLVEAYRVPVHVSAARSTAAWLAELADGLDPAVYNGCFHCRRPGGYPVCPACRVACWPSPARLLDMVADPTVEALGSHAYAAGRNADYLDPP